MCLGVAVGALQCLAGNAAAATTWTATEIYGEVDNNRLTDVSAGKQRQQLGDYGRDGKPSVEVQTPGSYANTDLLPGVPVHISIARCV